MIIKVKIKIKGSNRISTSRGSR